MLQSLFDSIADVQAPTLTNIYKQLLVSMVKISSSSEEKLFKGALLGLRQFLVTRRPLKMIPDRF